MKRKGCIILIKRETYREFLDRINSFEKKELSLGEGYFCGNASLVQKVDADNKFKKFYGDTIVFDLDAAVKEKLAVYLEKLYAIAPECFAERLVTDTFHMTLHDLSNSAMLENVASEMFWNEIRVLEQAKKASKLGLDEMYGDVPDDMVHELGKQGSWKIKMRTNYIFNMVNTSLVLGLYPVDEKEYEKIMALYGLFDEVRPLSYLLTPHITLAYFCVKGFSGESARKLEEAVREMNEQRAWEIELDARELYYQKFFSMNNYVNVAKAIKA